MSPGDNAPEIGALGGLATVAEGPSATAVVTAIEHAHGQALFGFARRLGLDDTSAADVVQEGLLRLFDGLSGGSRIVDPRAWVFTVVYRLAMDEHRRRSRWARLVVAVDHIDAPRSGDPVAHAEHALVWAEVDRLPGRQRAVLYLRYRADLPFDTVARVMGITSSAARSHATQAMAMLRSRLGEGEGA